MKFVFSIGCFAAIVALGTQAQVVVGGPGVDNQNVNTTTTPAFGNNPNLPQVLPQVIDSNHFFQQSPATQDQRGIGIANEPAIAPQFNEPMIGQQGPAPLQGGLPQSPVFLPPGVQPGLSDQGLIFPAPGTIIVGPQGDTSIITPQAALTGLGATSVRANSLQQQRRLQTVVFPDGSTAVLVPGDVRTVLSPQDARSFPASSQVSPAVVGPPMTSPLLTPQVSPALTPTGRGTGVAPAAGATAAGARGTGTSGAAGGAGGK